MKIATFNANSIRQRMPIITEWLAEHEPDVLAIQETKVEDGKFPSEEIEDLGYHVVFNGQKGTNGVATITKAPLQGVRKGFEDPFFPEDARILIGEVDGITIINTYVPNGTEVGTDKFEYKLNWLKRFRALLDERFSSNHPLVWLGDINIAPKSEDVYNPKRFYGQVGHHPLEFKGLDLIVDWGLTDCYRKFTQGAGHYTYWDYKFVTNFEKNFGWRIDHIYASPVLASKCVSCDIDIEPRKQLKPSDHTPVWAEFEV